MEKIEPVKTQFCRYLRAKNPFGTLEGGEGPWFNLDEANTIVWCVKAQGPVGPDEGMVDPPLCVKGRSCYEPPRG